MGLRDLMGLPYSETTYEFKAKFELHVSTLLNEPNASIQVIDLDLIEGKMSLSQYQSMCDQIEECYLNKHEVTGILDISDEKILDDEKELECEGKLHLTFSKTYCYDYGCYEYDMNVSVEVTSFKEKPLERNSGSWKSNDDFFLDNKSGSCYIRINQIQHTDKLVLEIGDQCLSYRRVMNVERFTSVWAEQFLKENNKEDLKSV